MPLRAFLPLLRHVALALLHAAVAMDRKALDRRSLERAASTDPAVREALKAVHRRVSFMKTQHAQPGQASKAAPRRAPSNEDLAPYACRRCNACTAVANGVADIVGTSLANCPWVIAKFRMERQVEAHESGYEKGDPEPDPRKESSYQHLCRSGFLGAKKADTARLPPVRPVVFSRYASPRNEIVSYVGRDGVKRAGHRAHCSYAARHAPARHVSAWPPRLGALGPADSASEQRKERQQCLQGRRHAYAT